MSVGSRILREVSAAVGLVWGVGGITGSMKEF